MLSQACVLFTLHCVARYNKPISLVNAWNQRKVEPKLVHHYGQVNGLSSMKDVSVTGLISRIMNHYVITADDGTQYELSAIFPWEAVSADYGSGIFAENLGKRMTAAGLTDGHTIWKASLQSEEPAAS